MSAGNRFLVSALIGIVSLNSAVMQGQERGARLQFGEKGKGDLEVGTGISLGLGGAKVVYHLRLVDENGFAYDTWSLVQNPEIVARAGLTKEQLATMSSVRDKVKNELILDIPTSLTSDEGKAQLEQRFLEAEAELLSVMEPDQLDRYEQARNQINLKQVGFEKFLTSKAVQAKLGLAPADVESISAASADLESRIERGTKDALRDANLELLDELSNVHAKQFDALFSGKARDEYLHLRMISGKESEPKMRQIDTPDLLRTIIRSNKIREPLELQDSQLKEIKALKSKRDAEDDPEQKAEFDNQLSQILDSNQHQRLMSGVTQREAARWGTAYALCCGSLGRMMELPDDEKQRLFDFGLEVNRRLPERIQVVRSTAWRESLASLPKASQIKILSMIGITPNP